MTARAEVVAGVLELLGRYPQATDDHDGDAWADLFTEDGKFLYGDRCIVGRRELHRFVTESVYGVHLCGLPAVTVSGEEATSVCSFMFHNGNTGALLSGYYHDTIDITGSPYRFKAREARVTARTEPSRPASL